MEMKIGIILEWLLEKLIAMQTESTRRKRVTKYPVLGEEFKEQTFFNKNRSGIRRGIRKTIA